MQQLESPKLETLHGTILMVGPPLDTPYYHDLRI